MHCWIINKEIDYKQRIVIQNDSFVAFIPFYARWPYEVHLYPWRYIGSIKELNKIEVKQLAGILKILLNAYNKMFDKKMPYVMVIHQEPTTGEDYNYYHFHFEFYPPYRTGEKLKFMAGCELGTGTFINDTLPEEKAVELREAISK